MVQRNEMTITLITCMRLSTSIIIIIVIKQKGKRAKKDEEQSWWAQTRRETKSERELLYNCMAWINYEREKEEPTEQKK